jgi:cobalt/nickel transport system permease protein
VLKGGRFIERSLVGALSLLREYIFSDEYALRPGLMQAISPRIKAAATLLVLVCVLFLKSLPAIIAIYLLCLLLAKLSRISLVFFLGRTWIFIPLFSLFIALPAIFSNFTPGEGLMSFRLFGVSLVVTRQGVAGAGLFVARVITSVSLAVLLSITTRHFQLLKALRSFGVPQLFIATLGMCYRYIYLFAGLAGSTYLAIKSRAGGSMGGKKGRHIVAWNIAYLWRRSLKLNEDVYNAMLARAFSGEPRGLR